MNSLLNKKWMGWIVLILLLLNLSALGTILYYSYQQNKRPHPALAGEPQPRHGKEMIRELQFDSAQADAFYNIRRDFHTRVKPSLQQMRAKRGIINDEVNKENPDTTYLNAVADTMGKIQAELKKETIRHFIRIRKICNPEQKTKLTRLYSGMFLMDEPGKEEGGHMGMGMKYRRGRQPLQDVRMNYHRRGEGGGYQQKDTLIDKK
jgi:Spy/CpxP family protein refolding chaperone